jgi:hypothetical protein
VIPNVRACFSWDSAYDLTLMMAYIAIRADNKPSTEGQGTGRKGKNMKTTHYTPVGQQAEGTQMAVRLSALRAGRPVLISVRG